MGVYYSFDLYFPIEQTMRVFEELKKVAVREKDRWQPLEMPNGQILQIPFSFEPYPDLELWWLRGFLKFDITILFEEDEAIRNYCTWDYEIIKDKRYYPIVPELLVSISHEYVSFSFSTRGSTMSRKLFGQSASMHRQFAELLQAAGGVIGLFNADDDSDYLTILGHPDIQIPSEDYELFLDPYPLGVNLDKWVPHLLTFIPNETK